MTVSELGHRMSSAEFTEWRAFFEVEPFGPAREDERAGVVASIVANVNRDPKRRPEPFLPSDFFAERLAERPVPEPVSLKTKLRAVLHAASRHGTVEQRPE